MRPKTRYVNECMTSILRFPISLCQMAKLSQERSFLLKGRDIEKYNKGVSSIMRYRRTAKSRTPWWPKQRPTLPKRSAPRPKNTPTVRLVFSKKEGSRGLMWDACQYLLTKDEPSPKRDRIPSFDLPLCSIHAGLCGFQLRWFALQQIYKVCHKSAMDSMTLKQRANRALNLIVYRIHSSFHGR